MIRLILTLILVIPLFAQLTSPKDSIDETRDVTSLLSPWKIENVKQDSFSYILVTGESIDTIAAKEILISDIGYRVQLGSTVNYYEALAIRDSAGTKFKEEIYLDYEQPNYKIRLGNFSDTESANAARQLAKQSGFSDAWVIRTKIVTKKAK